MPSHNPFKRRQSGSSAPPAPQSPPAAPPDPTTGPLTGNGAPHLQQAQRGEFNLVNYSPEELMQHVNQSLERVEFGWSWNIRLMENFSEVWAFVGPIILVLGTIGEVFLVLWLRQKAQEIIAGISIVAVALVMEGTFLAISYKASTIRNRAERRPNGPTELDRRKLRRQFVFWLTLAFGVCATQVIFIAAQTRDTDIGTWGVWLFAILRAVFTLVADGYTAFAHEEKPSTGERALEEQEQRAKLTDQFLEQKTKEVKIINDGTLRLREVHTEAEMKEDELLTRLEVKKLHNQAEIETLKWQQEQATMFTQLGNNMMRALFDPSLPDEQREKLLQTMQGFMAATRQLPPSHVQTTIEEVKEEDV